MVEEAGRVVRQRVIFDSRRIPDRFQSNCNLIISGYGVHVKKKKNAWCSAVLDSPLRHDGPL